MNTKKLDPSEFNVDFNLIPNELMECYKSMSTKQKRKLEILYGSAYNFLVVLYHLRFIEKVENKEIATKLDLEVEVVHKHLYNLGWDKSNDPQQNKAIRQKEESELATLLQEAKEKSKTLPIRENSKLKEALTRAKSVRRSTFQKLGFESREEYARVFYYLYEILELSARQLMIIFSLNYNTVHLRLKALGVNLSHEEGIKRKKNRKSQNYVSTFQSGRITRANSQLENFSAGSANENYTRVQLSNMLCRYLNADIYEVVVGVSNTGILGSLEIDIPVVVYDKEKQKIFRFAVEYNNDYNHDEERDKMKEAEASRRGWKYIPLVENSRSRYSNDRKKLNARILQICEDIRMALEL